MNAAQRAKIEKPPKIEGMYTESRIGDDAINLMLPEGKSVGQVKELTNDEMRVVINGRRFMDERMALYTSEGDDKYTAARKAEADFVDDIVWHDTSFNIGAPDRSDSDVKRAFEITAQDLASTRLFIPVGARTERERDGVVPVIRDLVENGRGLSWTPDDVDDDDDARVGYALALRRIVVSLTARDTVRDEAERRLGTLLGRDAVERLLDIR